MDQFKLRPMEVSAVRWDGKDPNDLHEYFGRIGSKNNFRSGVMVYGRGNDGIFLRPGEWIVIRNGEPMEALSDEAFAAKYERSLPIKTF